MRNLELDERRLRLRGGRGKAVRVARTAVGRGVFAQQRYKPEAILGEITGTTIDDGQYGSSYCMDLGDGRSLEPHAPFRFVNHSCEPNCLLAWFDVKDESGALPRRRMFLIAQTDIRPGVELTIDYAWPAAAAIPCRCQAASCRAWVVAEDELTNVISARP